MNIYIISRDNDRHRERESEFTTFLVTLNASRTNSYMVYMQGSNNMTQVLITFRCFIHSYMHSLNLHNS